MLSTYVCWLPKMRPTISLCMIVKDEEEHLGACLESVLGVVDEMIVVDTGSTDRTAQIAESHRAKVYHHSWKDNFSEARNYSIGCASSDWILQLDADEEFEKDDLPILKNAVESDLYNAVFLAIYNDLPQGRSKFYYPRLYRRGKAHYEGIVHNQLIYEGKGLHSEIRIYHKGYNLGHKKTMQKSERSRKLLEKQLQDDPDNIFAWHNLIRIYRNRKEFELVLRYGEDVLDRIPYEKDPNFYLMLLYDVAFSYLHLSNYEKAEKFCLSALDKKDNYIDILLTLGQVYLQKREHEKSIQVLQTYLAKRQEWVDSPKLNFLIVSTIEDHAIAYSLIGYCYLSLWSHHSSSKSLTFLGEAERAYKASSEIDPTYSEAYNGLGYVYLLKGKLDKALEEFNAALRYKPDWPEALLNLAQVYIAQDRRDKVKSIVERTKLVEDISLKAIRKLGDISVNIADYETAAGLYERFLHRNNCESGNADPQVLTNLGSCYAQMGQYESALSSYRAALRLDPNYENAVQNLIALKSRVNSL